MVTDRFLQAFLCFKWLETASNKIWRFRADIRWYKGQQNYLQQRQLSLVTCKLTKLTNHPLHTDPNHNLSRVQLAIHSVQEQWRPFFVSECGPQLSNVKQNPWFRWTTKSSLVCIGIPFLWFSRSQHHVPSGKTNIAGWNIPSFESSIRVHFPGYISLPECNWVVQSRVNWSLGVCPAWMDHHGSPIFPMAPLLLRSGWLMMFIKFLTWSDLS